MGGTCRLPSRRQDLRGRHPPEQGRTLGAFAWPSGPPECLNRLAPPPGGAPPTRFAPTFSAPRGFTLIEVLVVIAIISVLAAVLYPVFARAGANGRKGACMSNLRQIGLALSAYVEDWDSYLPPFTTSIDPGAERQTDRLLVAALEPYIKNNDIWFCPADRYARRKAHPDGAHTDHTVTSYHTLPTLAFEPVRLSLIDGPWLDGFGGQESISDVVFAYDDFVGSESVHSGGRNYLYLDARVKWAPD
jgi:prepilin-type N-terminal cleavage/methylation domain-containing protein/prepilin-type processing-associated H-X9-DG protein